MAVDGEANRFLSAAGASGSRAAAPNQARGTAAFPRRAQHARRLA